MKRLFNFAGLPSGNITGNLDEHLEKAREISWGRFGRRITFYLPGMFTYNGLFGKYPGVSITGTDCALQCDHCRTRILQTMIQAKTPQTLKEKCLFFAKKGYQGVLISGGCDAKGRLPWELFLPVIREIKDETDLYVSIHCGLLDDMTALKLKEAGVDQALIDVIGDDETYQKIYHVPFGISRIEATLAALNGANLPVVPHIVCGLYYGRLRAENKAIDMIARFNPERVVVVALMPLPNTPLWGIETPKPEEIAEIIVNSRLKMPHVPMSLGCARQRGVPRLEILAIDAGINRMALPSKEAVEHAMDYGLEIKYQRTCCSVSRDLTKDTW